MTTVLLLAALASGVTVGLSDEGSGNVAISWNGSTEYPGTVSVDVSVDGTPITGSPFATAVGSEIAPVPVGGIVLVVWDDGVEPTSYEILWPGEATEAQLMEIIATVLPFLTGCFLGLFFIWATGFHRFGWEPNQ